MNATPYSHIFFDLDGTLLPLDMDEFLRAYFQRLAAFAQEHGYDPALFSDAVNQGVRAMIEHLTHENNRKVFWQKFIQVYGPSLDLSVAESLFNQFYENDFASIGDGVVPNPAAQAAVEGLKDKGYRLFLTTMPLFPRVAVEWRLRWAGIDPALFDYITTYDNSFAAKPSVTYYQDCLDVAGVEPSQVLMVGNNIREDMAVLELGCDGYVVTDFLLNPDNQNLEDFPHGSMADFAAWAATFPEAHV